MQSQHTLICLAAQTTAQGDSGSKSISSNTPNVETEQEKEKTHFEKVSLKTISLQICAVK